MRQDLIKTIPLEVALTLPLTWDEGNILDQGMVDQCLQENAEWIGRNSPDELKRSKELFARNPQFFARMILAKCKAWNFAKSKNWISATSYTPSTGKFVVLERIDDDLELAQNRVKFYGMSGNFSAPQAMWDMLEIKRVSSEYAIAVFGDDRSCIEGTFFICLSYSHEEVDKTFFPDLPFCGAF